MSSSAFVPPCNPMITRRPSGASGKGAIVASVVDHVWPMIADGKVRPIVQGTLPMPDAAEAHRRLSAGGIVGKLVLVVP